MSSRPFLSTPSPVPNCCMSSEFFPAAEAQVPHWVPSTPRPVLSKINIMGTTYAILNVLGATFLKKVKETGEIDFDNIVYLTQYTQNIIISTSHPHVSCLPREIRSPLAHSPHSIHPCITHGVLKLCVYSRGPPRMFVDGSELGLIFVV